MMHAGLCRCSRSGASCKPAGMAADEAAVCIDSTAAWTSGMLLSAGGSSSKPAYLEQADHVLLIGKESAGCQGRGSRLSNGGLAAPLQQVL